jgi:hypothetical protein
MFVYFVVLGLKSLCVTLEVNMMIIHHEHHKRNGI